VILLTGNFPFSPLNQLNEARTVANPWLKLTNPSSETRI